MGDPYRILNVDSSCSEEELKTAYRNLLKEYSADLNAEELISTSEKLADSSVSNSSFLVAYGMGDGGGGPSEGP